MKRILTIMLFALVIGQIHAQSSPEGLKEISLTGLNTEDGYTFHFYSTDGKLNIGFSEIFIALTDKDNNFVENFTVSNFTPLITGLTKHSTPVGKIEKVDSILYKTWFSFLTSGTWSLSFNYTIGNTVSRSAVISAKTQSAAIRTNDTITQIGWFKDRHCVGAVTLPLTSSCGIGCATGAGNMVSCWNGGLGLFLYNAVDTGAITKDSARSDTHFLLFDAQSKELTRAFVESLPSAASGKISIKVKGYRVPNGIATNKSETYAPELTTDSIDHYLNTFHLLSIEGVVIENQSKSYSRFDTISYKLTPADLAPTNLSAVNYTGGTTIKFTPPANVSSAKSTLKGYKVQVYNKAGVLQDTYTTTVNDSSATSINVAGFAASQDYTFTVSALYPGSAVEVESENSNVVKDSIGGIALSVNDYPIYTDDYVTDYKVKLVDSFTYNDSLYYVTIAYPASFVSGSQTVKAYINKVDSTLQPYKVVDGGFYITEVPYMESMAMGTDGPHTNFIWNSIDSVYEATIDFSMPGDWRLSLKVYDNSTSTLIAGTDIDQNGDGSTLFWDVYLSTTTTGIKNATSNGISVYPTLSQGEITVVSPAGARIKVIDFTGQTIRFYQSSGSQTFNLNVPSGLYFVAVQNAGKNFVQKVIIKK